MRKDVSTVLRSRSTRHLHTLKACCTKKAECSKFPANCWGELREFTMPGIWVYDVTATAARLKLYSRLADVGPNKCLLWCHNPFQAYPRGVLPYKSYFTIYARLSLTGDYWVITDNYAHVGTSFAIELMANSGLAFQRILFARSVPCATMPALDICKTQGRNFLACGSRSAWLASIGADPTSHDRRLFRGAIFSLLENDDNCSKLEPPIFFLFA